VIILNKFDLYRQLKDILERHNYSFSNKRKIDYGLQFDVTKNNEIHKLRIYESKKKGVRLDKSLIQNQEVLKEINRLTAQIEQNALNKTKMKAYQNSYELKDGKTVIKVLNYLNKSEAESLKAKASYINAKYELNHLRFIFYKSGKLVIQGKVKPGDKIIDDVESLIKINYEPPKITAQVNLFNYKEEKEDSIRLQKEPKITKPRKVNNHSKVEIEDITKLIGIDESGKGDYFGPLVVAAVYVDETNTKLLKDIGVKDSKALTDKEIADLAAIIKSRCEHSVFVYDNKKYNKLYENSGNLNVLLGEGHAKVLEDILEDVDCKIALSDKFGDEKHIINALGVKGRKVELLQEPKAERNIAVAAASILARDEYVKSMNAMKERYGIYFPKGGSNDKIIGNGKQFVESYDEDSLSKVAKVHFKTTNKII